MRTRRSYFSFTAAAVGLLALAGCASQPDIAQDAALAPAIDAAGPIDPTSPEYLRVEIGDTVYFRTDSSDLTPSARALLDQQAAWLRANPTVEVRLEGHADERGTREYNIGLGVRRANAVLEYLISRGIEADRMTVGSFGRERPVAACPREECWAQNRRVQTSPQ